MKKVSIIILDYNSHQHTFSCLDSLDTANFTDLNVQVVVVDNASTEKLIINQNHYSNFSVEIINTTENSGFTGGNNIGITHAFDTFSPDYILLLNNDTVVDKDFLNNLVNFAESELNVGIVSPMIYFTKGDEFHAKSYKDSEKGKVIWFAGGSIDWKNMFAFHRGVDQVDRGQFDWTTLDTRRNELNTVLADKNLDVPYISTKEIDFATGCCMLIPSEVLRKVGMFDQSYFLYWEDVDLSYRIKQSGFHLFFYPKAIIWHKNAGSSGGSGSSLHKSYQSRNRRRFGMKYAPIRTKITLIKEILTR